MTTLFLSFAELENDGLRDRLNNGKVAKAMKGIAVSPPPAGYVFEVKPSRRSNPAKQTSQMMPQNICCYVLEEFVCEFLEPRA